METREPGVTSSACVEAFRSVKAGKNVFMWIILFLILIQLAGFVLVDFVGVIDVLQKPKNDSSLAATTQQADNQVEETESAAMWQTLLSWVLPATKFFAFVLAMFTVLTLMFAVKLSLVGRLGGLPGFMQAFYWSLILLAFITPWQQILGGSLASGAMYNLGELTREAKLVKPDWGAGEVSMFSLILYYGRFIAYPVLAILVWLLVMSKFSRGYRESDLAPIDTIIEDRLGEEETQSTPPLEPSE